MKNTCLLILLERTTLADLSDMISKMVGENTDQIHVRASWKKWKPHERKVRKILKKAKRKAPVSLSYHPDNSLLVLNHYVSYVLPHVELIRNRNAKPQEKHERRNRRPTWWQKLSRKT